MEQKIFMISDDSRIKLDIEFKQYYWKLRSVCDCSKLLAGSVDEYGYVDYTIITFNYGIFPVCTI